MKDLVSCHAWKSNNEFISDPQTQRWAMCNFWEEAYLKCLKLDAHFFYCAAEAGSFFCNNSLQELRVDIQSPRLCSLVEQTLHV